MLQLNSIRLKNYIIYKKALLKIDPGVTTIRGKNLDRKAKNASNAAGKSLVPGVVPGIFYDSTPLPMKSKKNVKEGFTKETELELEVVDGFNNNFTIRKFFQGRVKLDLLKNGKSLKFRTKDGVKERLLKLMPLNEDQFYSLAYLDTKRPPVFQYGTDAQRHHFIEALYKLNIYDKLAAHVKKDWDKNKEFIQELELLDRQLTQKMDENPGNPVELKQKQDSIVKSVTELRDRVSSLLQKLQECRTYETLTEGLDTSRNKELVQEELSAAKKNLKKTSEKLDSAQQQNKEYEAFEVIRAKREELEEKLEKVKDIKVEKAVQEKVKKDLKLLDEILEIQANNKKAKKRLEEIDLGKFDLSEKHKKQVRATTVDSLKKLLVQEKTKLQEAVSSLEDTESHLSGDHKNCPVCSSLLSSSFIKELLSEKTKMIARYKSKIAKIKQMVEYSQLYTEYKTLMSEIQDCEDPSVVEKRVDENQALLQKMRNKILLTGQLKELPKVSEKKKVPTKQLKKDKIELEEVVVELQNQLNKFVNLEKMNLPFTSIKQANKNRKIYETKLESYQPLLEKLQSKSHIIANNLSKSEVLVKDITDLSKSVNELKLKTSDYKILTALRKAFGARGIRRQRVAQIGLAIEDSLNKYSKMLFDYPIKFQLVITDTKFQILAQRNGQTSDVRQLSGAESRYFSLLTLVALLPFCPNSHRIDTVVMDEIEANMDESFRQRYISIFLPELLKIVPKVVVITPLSEKEFFVPKAHNYSVTKQNGVSTLRRL